MVDRSFRDFVVCKKHISMTKKKTEGKGKRIENNIPKKVEAESEQG
jgi:hypothetical protein